VGAGGRCFSYLLQWLIGMARKSPPMHYRISVVIERDADGYYAFCPQLQGCFTQGETYEEVLANIQDVVRLHIEDRKERGESIPSFESVAVTAVDVTA
jgi:predicted RNase H-like HicB family nuclease